MLQSGLILDVYDDINGEVLRGIYPQADAIPELVKSAHVLNSSERTCLPDDLFALVLTDGSQTLRKFACIDSGHTELSVQYFLKTAHKLPEEVQKIAAQNLLIACDWYGLEEPARQIKEAFVSQVMGGIGTAMKVQQAANIAKEVGNRNAAVTSMGGGIHTPQEVAEHALMMGKHGEVVGTPDMPLQGPTDKKIETTKAGTIVKSGSDLTNLTTPVKGEMPKRLPQAKTMSPHVDIRGVGEYTASMATPRGKTASMYALGDKYPLDDYAQVKMAAAYFDENGKRFDPADRHEYCRNLVKRASDLSIPVSDIVRKYGSEDYAPPEEIKVAFASRRDLLQNPELVAMLNGLEKQAGKIDPEIFCLALEEFDKIAGLQTGYDAHVLDPYWSTYGFEKKAEFSETIGNETVFGRDLETLGLSGFHDIKRMFGEDMAKEFQKDPIGIFKSLPVEQKKIFIRMARDRDTKHV